MAQNVAYPVTREVTSEVFKPVSAGSGPAQYPVLNGSDQYFTFSPWSNVSALYSINYATLNDDGFIVSMTPPVSEGGRVGASYHTGDIRALTFTDQSPLQGGSFMPGNGVDRYAQIPEITLSGDFEIEFWWVRQDRIGNDYSVLLSLNGAGSLRALDSAHPNGPDIVINMGTSYVFTDALLGVAQGEHVLIKVVRTGANIEIFVNGITKGVNIIAGDFIVEELYNSSRSPTSAVSNVLITNLTNNDYWEYRNKDDTDTVLKDYGPNGADGTWINGDDADRVDLPRINRKYIFTEPGRIYDAYGSGDATLVNLDASDWGYV